MGEPWKHRRMLDQKREIGAASADRLEQHEESDENFLRLPGLGRHAQELRQKRVETPPRRGRQLHIACAVADPGELREKSRRGPEAPLPFQRAAPSIFRRAPSPRRACTPFFLVGGPPKTAAITNPPAPL